MMGLFEKFKTGLKKSTPTFFRAISKVGNLFGGSRLSADDLGQLEEALYEADFGVATTTEILNAVQEAHKREKALRGQDIVRIAASVLSRILEGAEGKLDAFTGNPEVIVLVGINGSGKTTTAAKLANYYNTQGNKTILGACDTFRAAANEQIKVWSERLQIPLIASHHGADAAAVAFDAQEAGLTRKADILILDTAGRLHTKHNLMEELKKIRRVLQRKQPDAPHHAWLVIDGSIGSNSIEQARVFHESFGLTGLVITKLDGSSRGGSLVGIYRELKLPVYFVGLGEKSDDLQPFSKDFYINALFGVDPQD
jgi:fused signal recognition particle receptor